MKGDPRQQGFSLIAMIMVLLLLAMLALTAFNRQIVASARFNQQERRYLLAYNQAASALNWSLSLHWPAAPQEWYCQTPADGEFTACLRRSERQQIWLLRGESSERVGDQPIRLYRLLAAPQRPAEPAGRLRPLARGWLDFCPLRQEDLCVE